MKKRTFRLFNLSTFKPFCCLLLTTYCLSLIGCKKKTIAGDETRLITLSLAADNTTLPADGSSTTTITATVKYENDDTPASELTVEFHATQGTITDTAVTNSNGIATATLTSGTTTGKSTVSAYCKNIYKTTDIEFLLPEDSLKIFSLNADPQSIPADGESQSIITAVVVDTLDVPAPNVPIIFTTNLGTITQSDTTDSSGTATAILTSSATPGVATVIAAYSTTVNDSIDVIFTSTGNGDTIPKSIILYSISHTSIYVSGVGYNETSTLTFQVRDASGNPVAGIHQVDFTIQGGPDGGEYLNPDSATTDTLSLVTTHLNSGTKSGPLNISATVHGTSISSYPTPVLIVSGPPVQEHFTIATEYRNLYALWYVEVEDIITVGVADIHSNPVPDSTAVWFSSQCGIIDSRDALTFGGVVTRTLVSFGPWPTWPPEGFFWVYGETKDGSGNTIRDSARVLWSGDAILTLLPTTFAISNNSYEEFTVTLMDIYENPLSGGTTMEVDATVGDLEGDININIPDIQSGWTNFSFKLYDDEPDTTNTRRSTVTITVQGNGNATVAAYGTID